MSNHLHLVLEFDPAATKTWSDDEVATRWVRLYPPREATEAAFDAKKNNLLADAARLEITRQRLGDVSWLMKCLAEHIAKRANAEDICKGRFWEGRFKSQVIKDEKGLLAAMAYVDLNPIRAGTTNRLDHSHNTSVKERIKQVRDNPKRLAATMMPIHGSIKPLILNIKVKDYLELVDWTGRQIRDDKRGSISKQVPNIVQKIEDDAARWPTRVKAIGSGYWRVIGEAEDLIDTAKAIGQKFLCGLGFAQSLSKIS
ncbi:MAG: transposase [Brachymonas sp.]|nr:transposase [Brachymonas sp.]